MKIIRIDHQIISLEKVREVKITERGTGSKANPYESAIIVWYTNTEKDSYVVIDDDENHSKGNAIMDKIYNILSEG